VRITLTTVTAAAGGYVGPDGAHPDLLAAAHEVLTAAASDGQLIDAQAHSLGGSLLLLLSHDRGEDAVAIHELAWNAIEAASGVARKLQLHAPGGGLAADVFPGTLVGAGPSVAELAFEERPSEPLISFAGVGTTTGAFNLPLYKTFADPFNTAGLVLTDALHQGCLFEVHDTIEQCKAVFNTPEEAYDLLTYIGMPGRFVVKRVISRAGGEVVATASSERIAQATGAGAGHEAPIALVRCEGDLPTIGEATEPFAIPALVEGFSRGTHLGSWMPVRLADASAGRFDGPPRAIALGFEIASGKLTGPRDLFDHPSFDRAREQANLIADVLRQQGTFEPHGLPLDEYEQQQLLAVATRTESRWVDAS
jgi:fructose 1,6-bisphosphate aldolase/phosphatase